MAGVVWWWARGGREDGGGGEEGAGADELRGSLEGVEGGQHLSSVCGAGVSFAKVLDGRGCVEVRLRGAE